MKEQKLKRMLTIITFFMTLFLFLFIVYGIRESVFHSKYVLIARIRQYGILAPFFFLLLQTVQVIVPIVPGGMSCLAGVLAFGPFYGFLYNYIGLCIGSYCAYFISKTFGISLLKKIIKEETLEKYLGYIKSKKFEMIFFLGILIPGAPDDILCYVSGISGMSTKKFLLIILLCKPLALLLYSLFPIYFLR